MVKVDQVRFCLPGGLGGNLQQVLRAVQSLADDVTGEVIQLPRHLPWPGGRLPWEELGQGLPIVVTPEKRYLQKRR